MTSLQIELRIQKGIREYEDELVKKIVAAFEAPTGKPKNFQYANLERSQYQNLIQVALSTESSEVIKNFLRYQVGRGDKWGRGSDCLAERIIKHIQEDLKKKAEDITNDANKLDDNDVSEVKSELVGRKPEELAKVNDVYIELIRRYLGYGKRHLIYLKPEDKE